MLSELRGRLATKGIRWLLFILKALQDSISKLRSRDMRANELLIQPEGSVVIT